jgi:hypothetical protein
MFKPRGVLRQEDYMSNAGSECRFSLIKPDVYTEFRRVMPFDVEAVIRDYLTELLSEPSFQNYARMRGFRFKE